MRTFYGFTFAALSALLLNSCTNDETSSPATDQTKNTIVATVEKPTASRTAIGNETDGVVEVLWTAGDALGVFDAANNAQRKYTKIGTGSTARAQFAADGEAFSTPQYAYYPYSADNNNRSITNLVGKVLGEQSMASGTLQSDYKVGVADNSSTGTTHLFTFKHLLTIGRFVVDASGSILENQLLSALSITVTDAEGKEVPLSGDFTFNAVDATYTLGANTSNSVGMNWTAGEQPKLSEPRIGYACFFPEIKKGSTIKVSIVTTSYIAEFTTTSLVDFEAGYLYNFPLTVNRYESLVVRNRFTNEVVQTGPNVQTGTFTCACLNVDGLPTIINSEGPGEEGTTKIGNAINNLGWDFIAVSEDFSYHTQLYTSLSNYTHGTFRNFDVGNIFTGGRIDSDGLNLFWKNDGSVSAANEYWEQFTSEYGGIDDGANTLIAKGFRHYEVTVASGIVIDVYITHMNTYSDKNNAASMDAQHAQIRQIRDYMLANMAKNNRPAIIMGDSNMRYTRHQIQTNLIDPVLAAGYKIIDPWIELQRNNTYPEQNNISLMIPSKFGGGEILCANDNKGEVVDKMWYINSPSASIQLQAKSYKNETENFAVSTEQASYTGITYEDENLVQHTNYSITIDKVTGIADHFPVVVEFEYTDYSLSNE